MMSTFELSILQTSEMKKKQRVLDDFEITLMSILDDKGEIHTIQHFKNFIVLMSRASNVRYFNRNFSLL